MSYSKHPLRRFQISVLRTGEITRGMLVVDRREDESAYAPGANRSEAQKNEDDLHHNEDLGKQQSNGSSIAGVQWILQTPGSQALLRQLLQRVWNTSLP